MCRVHHEIHLSVSVYVTGTRVIVHVTNYWIGGHGKQWAIPLHVTVIWREREGERGRERERERGREGERGREREKEKQ